MGFIVGRRLNAGFGRYSIQITALSKTLPDALQVGFDEFLKHTRAYEGRTLGTLRTNAEAERKELN